MVTKKKLQIKELNAFLEIDNLHLKVVRHYRKTLTQNANEFAARFYDYLYKFSVTSNVLEEYQKNGGDISTLMQKQVAHLMAMTSKFDDPKYQTKQQSVGEIHYQLQISPSWIMGGYRLYQEHLIYTIHQSPEIVDEDRPLLMDSLNKLLLRDMGLMLEGYWMAAAAATVKEKNKAETLQNELSSLLKNLPQIIWSVDVVNNRPLFISPAANKFSPISKKCLNPCMEWTIEEDRLAVEAAWKDALMGKTVTIESRINDSKGTLRWFKCIFHPFTDNADKVIRIDGIMEEITDVKLTRDKLEQLATTDTLTGLTNRALWHDRVNQAIAMARRAPDKNVVIMFLDLNRFKHINDTLGHAAGDMILKQVAERLRIVLRGSDTLARLGGDEFAVLLPAEDDEMHAALKVAEKIHSCFKKPFSYHGEHLNVGVSIGIASYPKDGEDSEKLLCHADAAMYISKRDELKYHIYDEKLDTMPRRKGLLSQLKRGLRNQEFELHFQPKISLHDGQTSGVEALIRWNHPKHGVLLPDSFIPMAEKMKIINDVSDWVLVKALQQFKHWHTVGIHAPIAINVPASTLQDPKFLHNIKMALEATGTPPESIELEITENSLMSNIDYCTNILKNLNELGIAIAIDDFGTGYSSLAYLKRLPINYLKIDRSFVQDMSYDTNDAAIVRSVIDLGHNLGIKVIAEGVERRESLAILMDLGCDAAQGYHIGRPMPASQVDNWLKQAMGVH